MSSLIGVKFGYLPICRSPRLILSGFSGSGKSAVAQICATKFRWRLFEFDSWIQVKTGLSLPKLIEKERSSDIESNFIFARFYSEYFNEISRLNNAIITVPFNFLNLYQNSVKLYVNSFLVWIDSDLETMWKRANELEHNQMLYQDQKSFNQVHSKLVSSYRQAKAYIFNQHDLQLTYIAVQHAFRAF